MQAPPPHSLPDTGGKISSEVMLSPPRDVDVCDGIFAIHIWDGVVVKERIAKNHSIRPKVKVEDASVQKKVFPF